MPGKVRMDVDVDGVEEVAAAFEDLREDALNILEQAMNSGGSVIEDEATDNVERFSPGEYGSGRGSENIDYKITAEALDEITVSIAANEDAFYLNFHELGYTHPITGQRIQNPWLRRALDSKKRDAREQIKETLDMALAASASKHPAVQYLA